MMCQVRLLAAIANSVYVGHVGSLSYTAYITAISNGLLAYDKTMS